MPKIGAYAGDTQGYTAFIPCLLRNYSLYQNHLDSKSKAVPFCSSKKTQYLTQIKIDTIRLLKCTTWFYKKFNVILDEALG